MCIASSFLLPTSTATGLHCLPTPHDNYLAFCALVLAIVSLRLTIVAMSTPVTLDAVSARHASGIITDRCMGKGEPRLSITLYQGLMKADRFEYTLQKGTELGISRFVPIVSERTVARNVVSPNRLERWRRIMREAAEQAGRSRLPMLDDAMDFAAACEAISGPSIIGWEMERDTGIKDTLRRRKADIERVQVHIHRYRF